MATLDVYSTDAHLGFHDRELFFHLDAPYRIDHRSARRDVERELLRRGFKDGLDNIEDDSGVAAVTLTFVAETGGGGVTVPAGFQVFSAEDRTKVVFETDEALVLADGETGEVEATCTQFGEPGNVDIGVLVYFDALSGLESVSNEEAATGGLDHQLTKACTFRALCTVYMDLSRGQDDSFEHKRKHYAMAYKEELDLMFAAGLTLVSEDPDLVAPGGTRAYPRFRLERS